MKKVYLVDSENVGDVWVPLLVSVKEEEEVVVFYTQRSPHMSYENVRMLKETDKEAAFIKCFEGNNALDFQLVSELGYRLCAEQDCEYVIVSNDTGFDAVVRYWNAKEMPVSRLSGKECYRMLKGTKTQTDATAEKSEPPVPVEEKVPEPELTAQLSDKIATTEEGNGKNDCEPEPSEKNDGQKMSEDTESVVRDLLQCIGRDNLVDFHNALVTFFGEERGKELYLKIKGDSECNAYWSTLSKNSQREKFDIYCHIVFSHSEYATEEPEDFAGFLYQANGKRKNLNSLRAALIGQYGKDKGMKYYSLFKSHIKIMNRMQ